MEENKIIGYVFALDEENNDGKIHVLGYDKSVSPPQITLLVWDENIDFESICLYWFDRVEDLKKFYTNNSWSNVDPKIVPLLSNGEFIPVRVEKNFSQNKIYII